MARYARPLLEVPIILNLLIGALRAPKERRVSKALRINLYSYKLKIHMSFGKRGYEAIAELSIGRSKGGPP